MGHNDDTRSAGSEPISRRTWLKLSAVGIAGASSVGTVGAKPNEHSDPPDCQGSAEPVTGGGIGYQNTVRRRDATRVVTNLRTLRDALDEASRGDVIYVNDNAEIDMGTTQLSIPDGVTLASGRGVRRGRNVSPGALLYTNEYVGRLVNKSSKYEGRPRSNIYAGGDARITGLRIRGPDPESYEEKPDYIHLPPLSERTPEELDVFWSHAAMGVLFEGAGNEIDNCEMFGWLHSAVRTNENTHHVHHNAIYRNAADYLGYGVVVDRGVPLIEHNYFNDNRHSIAGTGNGGYELGYNLFGPDTYIWTIDIHGPGGTYLHVHHNTIKAVESFSGDPVAGYKIRGIPEEKAIIENNWFYHPEKPTYPGRNEAIWQRAGYGEYTNVKIRGNHYGKGEPADDIGVSAAPPSRIPPSAAELDVTTQGALPGETATAEASFLWRSQQSVHNLEINPAPPDGWTIISEDKSVPDSFCYGDQATVSWRLKPPEDPLSRDQQLTATATYNVPKRHTISETSEINVINLAGHWLFNKGSGSVATDSSGNGNEGTLHGATWTGKGALSFDGNNDYVDFGDPDILRLDMPMSISMWFKPDSWSGGHNRLIDHGAWGGPDYEGYSITSDSSGTHLIARYGGEGYKFYDTVSNITPEVGKWHHVVYTVENGDQKLHLDGTIIGRTNHTPSISYGSEPLYVGGQTGKAQYFDGSIDDVRLYNGALSMDDIRALYENRHK